MKVVTKLRKFIARLVYPEGDSSNERTKRRNSTSRRNRVCCECGKDSYWRSRGQQEIGPGALREGGSESKSRILDSGTAERNSKEGSGQEVGMMAYPAKAIANYFIRAAEKDNIIDLSLMKLMKLVYYAHGWHLGFYGNPLINETIEAWDYGPVIPVLYHQFKQYGSDHIRSPAPTCLTDKEAFSLPRDVGQKDYEEVISFLAGIWVRYSKFTANQLSNSTHSKDAPWSMARQRNPNKKSVKITNEAMKCYFHKLVVEYAK